MTMIPEQLAAAPCRGKMPLFLIPTESDPNPYYHEKKAKGLCAICPSATFTACGEDADEDMHLIRQGLTPKERGSWFCRVCYGTAFDTIRHSQTGNPTRRCSACHRDRQRKARARGR